VTPDVSATLLAARRDRIAAALPLDHAILLVGAGVRVALPENSDQTYQFRSHAEYFYLTGNECAGGVLGYDPKAPAGERWISFVPLVTEAERIWEGRTQLPGTPITALPAWLAARQGRKVASLGAPGAEVNSDPALSATIREALRHARRPKDELELATVHRAVRATAAGYDALRQALAPGVTERALQIELEAAFFRGGGDRSGYGTIVGSGPNSAVLHVEPSSRVVQSGEFVLVDAGAEVERYTADVTRTFVAGEPDAFQRDLYQAVLEAERRAITRCVVGAEWKAIHLAAAGDLTAALVDLGLLRGRPAELVEREVHTLFFPHGIGHMVGLGVRDASGLAPGRTRDPRPSLQTLRMDLPLDAGYLVTIEPGLYFIPALLNDPVRRARFAGDVNWSLVEKHLALGGVRIEDNILVTPQGPDVLTRAIPK
jgi:Xaa-Pro aminopeptidase